MLETQKIWGNILKAIRDEGDVTLLSATSDVVVTFTHDMIRLVVGSRTVYTLLNKYKFKLDKVAGNSNIVHIVLEQKHERMKTLEEKLCEMFGDKLVVKV